MIPRQLKYIGALYVSTRLILTVIGVVSRILLEPYHGKEYVWVYSKHLWLDIWGVWDSGWYLDVARHWYVKDFVITGRSHYAFFPLYPLLTKITTFFVPHHFIAGILVSNLALLVACYFLYKLVRLNNDEETALRAVKYLFLFPTAFILSGVFTESLFLVLALACFYYAKKERWAWVGISGFFLSLTRPEGVLITLPLLYLYLKQRKFSLQALRPDAAYLLLVPLGLFTFAAYTRYRMGDWFAYIHATKYWDAGGVYNPVDSFIQTLFHSGRIQHIFGAGFSLTALVLLACSYRSIGGVYLFFGMYHLLLPVIFNSPWIFQGMPRYILLVFPLYIIFASLGKNKYIDQICMIVLALLQGFLMVFWSNGFSIVV